MPLKKPPIENADLLLKGLNLNAKRHETSAHETRNAIICIIPHDSDQRFYTSSANGSDDPELSQMRPD